jgi:hypothetical protein
MLHNHRRDTGTGIAVFLSFLLILVICMFAIAHPAKADEAFTNTQLTALTQSVNIEHAKRERINGALAISQAVETFIDCDQTRRILLDGGVENDPVTNRIGVVTVVDKVQRAHPGKCAAAGLSLVSLEYLIFHHQSPSPMAAVTTVEAANIVSNAQQKQVPFTL